MYIMNLNSALPNSPINRDQDKILYFQFTLRINKLSTTVLQLIKRHTKNIELCCQNLRNERARVKDHEKEHATLIVEVFVVEG